MYNVQCTVYNIYIYLYIYLCIYVCISTYLFISIRETVYSVQCTLYKGQYIYLGWPYIHLSIHFIRREDSGRRQGHGNPSVHPSDIHPFITYIHGRIMEGDKAMTIHTSMHPSITSDNVMKMRGWWKVTRP